LRSRRPRDPRKAFEGDRRRYQLPEVLPVGVFHADAAGHCLYVNARWREIAGLTRDEARATGWIRALHPDDRERVVREWESAVARAAPFQAEYRFQRPDGATTWILARGIPTKDPSGRLGGYAVIVTDIDDRRQVERALRESEDHYRDLVEHSQDLMCTHDLEGRILSINAAAVKISGYDADFFRDKNIRDFVAPKYRDKIDAYLAAIRQDGVAEGIMRVRTRTGESRLWEYKNTLRSAGVDSPIVRGVARDITEHKRAQEALARLASIVESSYDAIIGQTLDGTITSWNRSAERTFGYAADEVQGRSIALLIPPERPEPLESLLARLEREGRIHLYETVWLTKAGERINVSLTISPIRNELGRTIGVSTIARDITERKRLEAEREQFLGREQEARREAEAANRTKDEFLAIVSHELRTPLTSILGWVRQVRSGRLAREAVESALEIIERNARIQTGLIEDILDVSRIIAGSLRLDLRPVDPATIIVSAIETIRPAADSKGIHIEPKLDPDVGTVSGDPGRLQQVAWNLLSNAVKFTPKGGRIDVRLERAQGNARLTVSDTGRGIHPDFLASVFERFSQADASTTRKHSGLGLGLAIVRNLVELHGGTVHAESAGEGKGATFVVELPLVTTPQHLDATAADPAKLLISSS